MSDNRPLGDPEIAVEILKLRIAELEQAIRRLADQDATLSVQGGNVIVDMECQDLLQKNLTAEEREAVEAAVAYMSAAGCHNTNVQKTLRGLLERLGGER